MHSSPPPCIPRLQLSIPKPTTEKHLLKTRSLIHCRTATRSGSRANIQLYYNQNEHPCLLPAFSLTIITVSSFWCLFGIITVSIFWDSGNCGCAPTSGLFSIPFASSPSSTTSGQKLLAHQRKINRVYRLLSFCFKSLTIMTQQFLSCLQNLESLQLFGAYGTT